MEEKEKEEQDETGHNDTTDDEDSENDLTFDNGECEAELEPFSWPNVSSTDLDSFSDLCLSPINIYAESYRDIY